MKKEALKKYDSVLGEISFGSSKLDFCDSNVNFVPVSSKKGWSVQSEGYSVNGVVVNEPQPVEVIYNEDLLLLPEEVHNKVVTSEGIKSVGEYFYYIDDCKNVDSLPVISVKIGGKDYELRGEDYTVEVINENIIFFILFSF